jgi:protein required for attachment to host cells
MAPTWVLVADGAKARLLALDKTAHAVAEIEDFTNPDARGREPARDRPPRTHDRFGESRHAIEAHTTEREKTTRAFARELTDVLQRGHADHRYEDLILVAPPHFLGTLNAELDATVRDCVSLALPKDLTSADAKVILEHLPPGSTSTGHAWSSATR